MDAPLSLHPTSTMGLESLADLFRRCFEGYLVEIPMTAPMLGEFTRSDHIDLFASRVVRDAGQDVALALIARRGPQARVAAMGVVASHRRQGVGRWLMEQLVSESIGRGEQSLQLEVIEQNLPAKALYESMGFAATRRLVGFACDAPPRAKDDPALEWITPQQVARVMIEDAIEDVGWTLAPETAMGWTLPSRAVRLGPAVAVISDPEAPTIGLKTLYVPRASRRQGLGSRLARALAARFPHATWRVRVVVPEGRSDAFFASLGFVREALTQLEMVRSLHRS